MNTNTPLRPEERRRSGHDGALWGETLPTCFRSEAFAEDLEVPAAPVAVRAAPRRRPPASLAAAAAWGLLPGLATR